MQIRTRIARGIYVSSAEPTLAEKCAALLAAGPPDCAVVGLAAAQLHGLWLPSAVTVAEVAHYSPGRRSADMLRSRRDEFAFHRWEIPLEQLTLVDGIPATSLARTWWDLAGRLSLGDLVAAGDRALQLGASLQQMTDLTRRKVRRRGNARAREALPLLDERSRSRPESHLRVVVRQADLHCFEVNAAVHDTAGGWLAEADLACRETRIALEYQGSDHADLQRMRSDITRETDLRQHDWLVLKYGPAQVFSRPWQIGPELVQLHRRRLAR